MPVVELFMLVDFYEVQMWYLYHGYMDERFHLDLENIWILCSKMCGAVLLVSWGLDQSSRFLQNSWFPFFKKQCFITSLMILTENALFDVSKWVLFLCLVVVQSLCSSYKYGGWLQWAQTWTWNGFDVQFAVVWASYLIVGLFAYVYVQCVKLFFPSENHILDYYQSATILFWFLLPM